MAVGSAVANADEKRVDLVKKENPYGQQDAYSAKPIKHICFPAALFTMDTEVSCG
jgi:hypothetical protein